MHVPCQSFGERLQVWLLTAKIAMGEACQGTKDGQTFNSWPIYVLHDGQRGPRKNWEKGTEAWDPIWIAS